MSLSVTTDPAPLNEPERLNQRPSTVLSASTLRLIVIEPVFTEAPTAFRSSDESVTVADEPNPTSSAERWLSAIVA